jgi:pimeloyl-ACP methyl ester carboxylesterase
VSRRFRYATVNGVRLRYLDYGRGHAVLFIHGLGGSIENWMGVLSRLPPEYRVVALDLRGFGSSQRPAALNGVADFAADVEGIIDYLGLVDLTLVGYSFGGVVALEAYRRVEPYLRGLVLVSTLHRLPTQMVKVATLLRSRGATAWPEVASLLLYRLRGDRVVAEVSRAMSRNDPAYMAEVLNALRGVDYSWLAPQIQRPVLVVVGDKDRVTPPEEVARFASMFRSASLTLIRDAGHLLLLEAPGELANAITGFLEAGSGARGQARL